MSQANSAAMELDSRQDGDVKLLRDTATRPGLTRGTTQDRTDMQRMGFVTCSSRMNLRSGTVLIAALRRKKQEMRRHFRQLSTMSFSSCVMGT